MKGELLNTLRSIRQYGTKSIHFRNLLLISTFILIPVAILGVLLFNVAVVNINRELSDSNTGMLKNIQENVDAKLRMHEGIVYLYPTNSELIYLSSLDKFYLDDIEILQKYRSLVESFAFISEFYNRTAQLYFIFPKSNTAVSSQGFIIRENEFDFNGFIDTYFKENEGQSKWRLTGKNRPASFKASYMVISRIPVAAGNSVYLLAGVDDPTMRGLIQINESDNQLLLLDSRGIIQYDSAGSRRGEAADVYITSELTGEKGFFIGKDVGSKNACVYTRSPYTGWYYVSVVPTEALYAGINRAKRIYMAVILLVAVTSAVFSIFITQKVSEPINIFLSLLKDREGSASDQVLSKVKFEEIKYIASNLVASMKENVELKKDLDERLKMLKNAQLEALQSQINPHFLYNTLESINWSARKGMGMENETSGLITALSLFLRFSLDHEENLVFIANELEHLKNYIFIQRHRHNHSFDVEWSIPKWMEEHKIIKITLQPLLENSIHHGLSEIKSGGLIKITGWKEDGDLFLSIWDNGAGIEEGQLETLNREISRVHSAADSSIGLRNVNMRYHILFGDAYGLKVESEPGRWTKVTVRFPAL